MGQAGGVELAPAKLTLSLRITDVREDGLHEIDAEMVTVDLYDELTFSPGRGLTITGHEVPDDGRPNLVERALRLAGRQAHVTLNKRIPAGAGLGGGSADAAAVLRWTGITHLALAARLGSDVPFCVRGGRARVRGTGEIVEPLPYRPAVYTLSIPPLHVPTGEVYRTWDELASTKAAGPNDLEAAALVVCPPLAEWRDRLADATGETPVLAGSGSTWFVPGAFPKAGIVVRTTQPIGR